MRDPAQRSETELALEGVRRLEDAYRSLGMPVSLREAGIVNADLELLTNKALPREDSVIGGYIVIGRKDALAIYKLAE